MFFSFTRLRYSRISFGTGCFGGQLFEHLHIGARSRSWSSCRLGSFSLSNSTSCQLLRRIDVEFAPGLLRKSCARSSSIRSPSTALCSLRIVGSIAMPLDSISTSTSISGVSRSSFSFRSAGISFELLRRIDRPAAARCRHLPRRSTRCASARRDPSRSGSCPCRSDRSWRSFLKLSRSQREPIDAVLHSAGIEQERRDHRIDRDAFARRRRPCASRAGRT